MQELTVKEKIIKILLKSPRTTGDIAKDLGYIDNKGFGKYNAIEKDLKTLQSAGIIGYEKRKIPGKRGPVPTTYFLKMDKSGLEQVDQKFAFDALRVDISAIMKIAENYPLLISELQKNEWVRYRIAQKHRWAANCDLFLSDSIERSLEICNSKNISKKVIDFVDVIQTPVYDLKKYKSEMEFSFLIDLSDKFSMSYTFFETFLLKEPEYVERVLTDIFWLTKEGQELKLSKKSNPPFANQLIKPFFETCIFYDIVEGKKNESAKEYLENINKQQTKQIIDLEKRDFELLAKQSEELILIKMEIKSLVKELDEKLNK